MLARALSCRSARVLVCPQSAPIAFFVTKSVPFVLRVFNHGRITPVTTLRMPVSVKNVASTRTILGLTEDRVCLLLFSDCDVASIGYIANSRTASRMR